MVAGLVFELLEKHPLPDDRRWLIEWTIHDQGGKKTKIQNLQHQGGAETKEIRFATRRVGSGVHCRGSLQGYLAHKNPPPHRAAIGA